MTEEQVLMGRLRDLAKRAYEKNIYTYITYIYSKINLNTAKFNINF